MIPLFMNAFASLPSPVGFAVNFVVFSTMAGLAFTEFDSYEKAEQNESAPLSVWRS